MVGRKKLFLLLTLVCFTTTVCLSPIMYANGAIDIKSHENRRNEIKQKNNDLKKVLKDTQVKIDSKRKQCDLVNTQIVSLQKQIEQISNNIKKLDTEISEKQDEIANKQKEIDENMNILLERLKAIYMAGEVHVLDIILNSKSFSELIDKAEIIQKISSHDNKLIETLKSDIASIETEKNAIESKREQIASERTSLSDKENELKGLLKENEKLLIDLEGEKKVAETEIDENTAEYQKIDQEIKRFYQEEERKRLEAQKKANNSNNSNNNLKLPVLSSGSRYEWPVPGFMRRSSEYMEKRGNVYHGGIDIASDRHNGSIYGKSVVAVDSGMVMACYSGCHHDYAKLKSCGCGGGYGNYVFINHGNGKMSIYGHLSKVSVHTGQIVKKGEIIGAVGTTGHSTGPHLHFETRLNGIRYNPLSEYSFVK